MPRSRSRSSLVIVALLLLTVWVWAQAPAPPTGVFVGAPPAAGTNPIAAGRLPAGQTTLPVPVWAAAGVTGGIPSVTTECARLGTAGQSRTFVQSVTATDINNAIQGCNVGSTDPIEYVILETGTYEDLAAIDFGTDSRVVLRGEGPDNTLLYMTGITACLGQWASICIHSSGLTYYGPGPPQNSAVWSGTYTQGATTIQLDPNSAAATLPNLSVGMFIHLDQLDDDSDPGDVFVCGDPYEGSTGCTQQGSTPNARSGRAQNQRTEVISLEGGNCGTTGNGTCDVGIAPGIIMPNVRSGQTPGAWWGSSSELESFNGIEYLSVDTTPISAGDFRHAITMIFARDSWVKGVRFINCPTPKTCINLYGASHVTVRDSYFYGNTNDSIGSTTYGVEIFGGGGHLIENNIAHHRASPWVSDGDQGSVIAYNYTFDDWYNPDPCEAGSKPAAYCNFMQSSNYSHEAGNGMILHEGNEGTGGKADIIHGTSNLFTYHRNRFIGWEPVKVNETSPIILYAFNRYYAFTCNVLGESTYAGHADYDGDIWRLGDGYGGISGRPDIPTDDVVADSTMRWGNWDVVTSTSDNGSNDQTGTRWVAGEVPSGISVLPNPVPSTQTCPNSFYLSAKPSWWGASIPWPAIGPDVSGGDISNTGGHVFKNPAHTCFDSLSADMEYAVDGYGIRPQHFTGCSYLGGM